MKYILVFLFSLSGVAQGNFRNHQNIEQELASYRVDILENKKEQFALGLGVSIDLGAKRNGSLRAYATVAYLKAIYQQSSFATLGGFQTLIEFYRGGLGTSFLNEERSKINIELRNNFMLLAGWDRSNQPTGKPAFVTIGANRSPLFDPLSNSISFGTTFINGVNHKRNQRLGTFSLSPTRHIRLSYFNDNFKPIFHLPFLADSFDRYWSGGGSLGFYNKNNSSLVTDFVIGFDNYIGYQPNLYETVDFLKLDNISYSDVKEQMFNQSRVIYQFGIQNTSVVHWSTYQPYYWDLQKWIHYAVSHNPLHPRPRARAFTLGMDYHYIKQK